MFCSLCRFSIFVVCVALLTSCAADRHLRNFSAAESASASVPRFIELAEEQSISTIHFPRGTYVLEAEDNRGYYYRAPRRVVKHTFSGLEPYEGGIFLARKDRTLRGYIVWAAGRTKVGDLSRARFTFGN